MLLYLGDCLELRLAGGVSLPSVQPGGTSGAAFGELLLLLGLEAAQHSRLSIPGKLQELWMSRGQAAPAPLLVGWSKWQKQGWSSDSDEAGGGRKREEEDEHG